MVPDGPLQSLPLEVLWVQCCSVWRQGRSQSALAVRPATQAGLEPRATVPPLRTKESYGNHPAHLLRFPCDTGCLLYELLSGGERVMAVASAVSDKVLQSVRSRPEHRRTTSYKKAALWQRPAFS